MTTVNSQNSLLTRLTHTFTISFLNFQFAADWSSFKIIFKKTLKRKNVNERTHFSSGCTFSPGTGVTGRFRPSVKFTLQVHALLSCPPVAPRLRHWVCRPAGSCGREWTPSERRPPGAEWEGGRKEGRGGWMMRSLSLCSQRTAWPGPLPAMSRASCGGAGGENTGFHHKMRKQVLNQAVQRPEWALIIWFSLEGIWLSPEDSLIGTYDLTFSVSIKDLPVSSIHTVSPWLFLMLHQSCFHLALI